MDFRGHKKKQDNKRNAILKAAKDLKILHCVQNDNV